MIWKVIGGNVGIKFGKRLVDEECTIILLRWKHHFLNGGGGIEVKGLPGC